MSDKFFATVELLVGFNGVDAAAAATDEGPDGRVLTFNGNAQLDTADKQWGSASLLLDGTGDFVTAPNSSDLSVSTGDLTIEAWIKIAATGRIHTITDKRSSSSAQEHTLSINASNQPLFQAFSGGSTVITCTGTSTLTTAGWHHIAVTRSGTTWRLFLDGGIEASGTQSGAPSTNTDPFRIGRSGFSTARDFQGWIDEVRFTSGQARYTAAFTVPVGPFDRGKQVGASAKRRQSPTVLL